MIRKKYSDCYDDQYYHNDKKDKPSCHNSSQSIVNVYCDCKKERERSSIFKAVQNGSQPVSANTRTKVFFPLEVFDTNNEYNPTTSTFIPRQDGIYSINASIFFTPSGTSVSAYAIILEILVNDDSVSRDTEEGSPSTSATLDTSTIIQLQAGDRVEVFAEVVSANGSFFLPESTRFEGFRISEK